MTGHFQSKFAIGETVLWHTLRAKVLSVRFTAERTQYEIQFEAGGADAIVDSSEVGPCQYLASE